MGIEMALMLGELYDALRAGNTPEDKARAAAEEVAAYESRLGRVEGDLMLLKWMVGANIALTVGIFIKLIVH
jgi:hypothetical protein